MVSGVSRSRLPLLHIRYELQKSMESYLEYDMRARPRVSNKIHKELDVIFNGRFSIAVLLGTLCDVPHF